MGIFLPGIPSFLALEDLHPQAITVVCHCYWYPYVPTIISGPFIDSKPWRKLELAPEPNRPRLNKSKLTTSHLWPTFSDFGCTHADTNYCTVSNSMAPLRLQFPQHVSRKGKISQNRGTKMNRRGGVLPSAYQARSDDPKCECWQN